CRAGGHHATAQADECAGPTRKPRGRLPSFDRAQPRRGVMMGRALAVFEYHLVAHRRHWRSTVVSSLTMPILYFAGMGLAVGALVDRKGSLDIPYVQFIGPALLAFTGLRVALNEAG